MDTVHRRSQCTEVRNAKNEQQENHERNRMAEHTNYGIGTMAQIQEQQGQY
jgi:hypothetical protein